MVNRLNQVQRNVLKSFCTGSISFGSISLEAHSAIAEGINRMAMTLFGVDSIAALKKILNFKGPISRSGEGG